MKMPTRRGSAGFTLIEVITVITIILILAGLVVSGAGFVKDRQANEKARVQIALISKAVEDYKLDMGYYPSTDDSADGSGQSKFLFKALYFDALSNPAKKLYLAELDPAVGKQKWTSGTASDATTIVDPWGGEYRYRSAIKTVIKDDVTTFSNNNSTQNPDFDLWSSGKDKKTSPATPSATTNRDDIKNF